MDPWNNDTDDFQQSYATLAIGESPKSVSILPCFQWTQPDPGWFWGVGDERRVQIYVQLHVEWPSWIHETMILMTCSNYSPLELWEGIKTVSKVLCFKCGHSQIQADFGVLGMKEGSKHVQLHVEWPSWIHETMILMTFSNLIPFWQLGKVQKVSP